MKYLMLAIFSLLLMVSCQKESNLNKVLSESDRLAIEGMEKSYETTKLYNDSLIWCNETLNNCSALFYDYCDSIFHVFDNSYEMYHTNYSHNNIEDDHHHSSMSQHHHRNEEHEKNDGEEDHHGHTIESHNLMVNLRENHKLYHP